MAKDLLKQITNTRVRTLMIVVGAITIAVIAFAIKKFTSTQSPLQEVKTTTTSVPQGIESTPGGKVTEKYRQLQQQANIMGTQRAEAEGSSFVPTIVGVADESTRGSLQNRFNNSNQPQPIDCVGQQATDQVYNLNRLLQEQPHLAELFKNNPQFKDLVQNSPNLAKLLAKQPQLANMLAKNPSLARMIANNPKMAAMLEQSPQIANLLNEDPNFANLVNNNPHIADLLAKQPHLANMIASDPQLAELIANNPHIAKMLEESPNLAQALQKNPELAKIVAQNPEIAAMLSKNPELANLIAENPELADLITKNPQIAKAIAANPKLAKLMANNPDFAKLLADNPHIVNLIEKNPALADLIANDPELAKILARNPALAKYIAENPELARELIRNPKLAAYWDSNPELARTMLNQLKQFGDSSDPFIAQQIDAQMKDAIEQEEFKRQQNADLESERLQELNDARLKAIDAIAGAMDAQASSALSAWNDIPTQAFVQGEAAPGNTKKPKAGEIVDEKGNIIKKQEPKAQIKAGSLLFAVLDTAVNSDEPSPIMARIVHGKYKGTKLIGSMTPPTNQYSEKVVLRFDTMNMPDADNSIKINAVAIDPNTARAAIASNVDNHYLFRYGSLFAASFLEGWAKARADSTSSVNTNVTSSGSTVATTSKGQTGSKEQIAAGIGKIGEKLTENISEAYNRPATIKVNSGISFGLLFLTDVTGEIADANKDSKALNSLSNAVSSGAAAGSGSNVNSSNQQLLDVLNAITSAKTNQGK